MRNLFKKAVSLGVVSIFLMTMVGCSTHSSQIDAMYVSSNKYMRFSCDELYAEQEKIARQVAIIAGKQDKEAVKDAVALTVGLVVFWPALFFMIGKDKKHELSQLKGEYEAIIEAIETKQCGKKQVSN